MTSPLRSTKASVNDLHDVEGKAELIAGRIVQLMPSGSRPGQVGGPIYRSLDEHATKAARGVALPDNVGFVVPELASGRQSFSPDAAYYIGDLPADEMDFIDGPPMLAVEVRSKGDYGAAAESERAEKRADYFEAGTLVVWDVDLRAECIRVYRSTSPDQPDIFHKGQQADAESAAPGWRMSVDEALA